MKFRTAMPLCRRLEDSDTDTAAKAGSAKSKTLTYITVLTILCALVAALGVAPATAGETVLHSFNPYPRGGKPFAKLCLGPDGKFYGTASNGGVAGAGVVFKLDTTGHETVLYSFTGGADGGGPLAGLTFDSAGNLYGTTASGGGVPHYGGVVYKLDPTGHETVLHSFTYGADGGFPWGGVTFDSAGNLYGTTWSGGPPSGDDPGVVYKVDPLGNFTAVYTFTGFTDGGGSRSNVIFDSAGNLYGTTEYGGQGPCSYFGCGVVFELDPTGHQTVLYSFSGGSDGAQPGTGLIRDAAGNLYGTTAYGGSAGAGVVYQVTPGGSSPTLTQTVHRSFGGPRFGPNHPVPGEPLRKRVEPTLWRTQ